MEEAKKVKKERMREVRKKERKEGEREKRHGIREREREMEREEWRDPAGLFSFLLYQLHSSPYHFFLSFLFIPIYHSVHQ